ncbi:PREDICTED: mediator of DNA damage checkpoint protein 1-like [Camelina sativa]|uniref:Mediator of DNA damage checkpoint protein 1-like n=1 Tax=Camelina sativa TaxID=90675 RepID=A0ABM0W2X2_CAMSA|nr:PREDICTED: mediator of DNA damage checkpoint protein 1-like [Camelina sativa]XP_010464918.1 PREDICTED: mediator of DNA damage checkpoint protein 1-like [Camelina sativa]XP_010464919.1 PREDICTED: mediator of DNA damage checkpoint protein 1-like [Camelina sativa]XP_010464920.1 PREDICTED: mediator of DNA damage checkpoint protein 1-like [Camelina sativa]
MMARLRPRQLEPGKTGPLKFGLDGEEEEDGWVFVKKQRIIIVLPSLPPPVDFTLDKPALTFQLEAELRDGVEDAQDSNCDHTVVPEHCIFDKPETSVSQAELRDVIADTHETTPPVHTLVHSLPLPEQFTLQKPEASQSQVELRDCVAETHELTTPLPVTEHFTLQKPTTSQLQVEKRDVIADTKRTTTPLQTVMSSLSLPDPLVLQKPATSQSQVDTRETALVHTILPSLPVPEHCTLQKKPATSKSQAESRTETRRATLVHTVVPSLPVPEHCTLQKKPATSKSQAESRTETRRATLVHTVIPSLLVPEPATSQSQAEIRAETRKATLVQTVVPSLPVIEQCTSQKTAASQPQTQLRDMVVVTHAHTVEPEACPDFTSVDKPEIVTGRNVTTRKGSAPRRSLQDCSKNRDRRMEIHKSRAGHKPIRFPRVMCSSVVMDNEKLRVLNLEKKVEKAGGLNQWVGSIGLGREFERMLRGQRMNKFQMANLTMEKLKQMGALAVGPRRKLIHAICCVYHPHCLRASF